MKFAVTFGQKYSQGEVHPASSDITGRSYVVIYSNPALDPNPVDVRLGVADYWDAEKDARKKATELLETYAFIYPYDAKYDDSFTEQIRLHGLKEVALAE